MDLTEYNFDFAQVKSDNTTRFVIFKGIRVPKLLTGALALLLMAGCAATPTDPNAGKLYASEGVRNILDEKGVDSLDTEEEPRIKCVREKILGSHRVQRTCMTVDEWDAREQDTQRDLYNRRRGTCGQGGPGCGGDG